MRKKVAIISLLLALTSCYRQPAPDGKRTREQFAASIKSFPYTTPEERHLQLIGNYGQISVGMSKEQIAFALGEPDYTDVIAHKRFFGMKPHGSQWVYGLHCTSQFCGTSGEDKLINVLFDLDGKAKWIVPHGIEWLVEKGGPWSS